MNHVQKLPRNTLLSLVLVGLASISPSAFAVTDYSAITGAVDFATVATGVVAVFALVAVVLVAMKGGRMLMSAIKG